MVITNVQQPIQSDLNTQLNYMYYNDTKTDDNHSKSSFKSHQHNNVNINSREGLHQINSLNDNEEVIYDGLNNDWIETNSFNQVLEFENNENISSDSTNSNIYFEMIKNNENSTDQNGYQENLESDSSTLFEMDEKIHPSLNCSKSDAL